MQNAKLQNDKEIMNILGSIEKICNSNKIPQQKNQTLFNLILSCLQWVDIHKEEVDSETSLQLIEFLSFFNREKKFTQLFQDYRLSFLININRAYFTEQLKSSDLKSQQIITDFLQLSIKEIKQELEKNVCLGYNELMEQIKLEFTLIKLYLPLIHNLSELEDHQKALKLSIKCLDHFSSLINILHNIFSGNINKMDYQQEYLMGLFDKDLSLYEKFSGFLNLSSKINYFVSNILTAFHQNNNELLSKNSNYEKFQEFFKDINRVKLYPIWIDKIKLSNFFSIEYIFWDKLNQPINYDDIFTEIFLSLLIMFSSILYFQISKENRIHNLDKLRRIQTSGSKRVKPIFEQNILIQALKSSEILFSKELHNSSIQILQHYFNNNQIVIFQIKVFSTFYQENKDLEQIEEEEDDLNMSGITRNVLTSRNSMLDMQFIQRVSNINNRQSMGVKSQFFQKESWDDQKDVQGSTMDQTKYKQTRSQQENEEKKLSQRISCQSQDIIKKRLFESEQYFGKELKNNKILQNLGISSDQKLLKKKYQQPIISKVIKNKTNKNLYPDQKKAFVLYQKKIKEVRFKSTSDRNAKIKNNSKVIINEKRKIKKPQKNPDQSQSQKGTKKLLTVKSKISVQSPNFNAYRTPKLKVSREKPINLSQTKNQHSLKTIQLKKAIQNTSKGFPQKPTSTINRLAIKFDFKNRIKKNTRSGELQIHKIKSGQMNNKQRSLSRREKNSLKIQNFLQFDQIIQFSKYHHSSIQNKNY